MFCLCGDKWIGKAMVLLVLTLAFSNIFNLARNKDTGENDISVFPKKCCDVMELKVPGEEAEKFRFYSAQNVNDKICEDDEYAASNYEFCNAEISGFRLLTPFAYENLSAEEENFYGMAFFTTELNHLRLKKCCNNSC